MYTLAEYQYHADDPDFLQGDVTRLEERAITKRSDLMHNERAGVIAGLAQATERYAGHILNGETAIFPEVMAYYTEKLASLHR